MKRILYIFLLTTLLVVSACDAETENSKNDKDAESLEDFFNIGEFETIKGANDIGTYEIGPVAFDIISVLVKKGALDEEKFKDYENIPKGEIEYIQIHTKFITTNKDINFSVENFQLSTDSGNTMIEVESFLSTGMFLPIAYTKTKNDSKNYNVSLAFILDEHSLEDVQEATLYVEPPTDEDDEPLGESLQIDIPILIKNN